MTVQTHPETPEGLSLTAWPAGGRPYPIAVGDTAPDQQILWADLTHSVTSPDREALLRLCPGLRPEMLSDLLTPDTLPEGREYDGGSTRLVSTCGLRYESNSDGSASAQGAMLIQPVELLARREWLISCWHQPRRITQSGEEPTEVEVVGRRACQEAVERRWLASASDTGGDLGLLLMHQLALTYGPTERDLSAVLEDWELQLYEGGITSEQLLEQREALRRLWRLRAVMRDWLSPLNRPGMSFDIERVWLPCVNHDEANAIDNRLDGVLRNLAELGKALRSSFHLVHLEESERERERREDTQRRVELGAAIFLIPTFIFGLYGANTWLPGQGQQWGFVAMLLTMALFTGVGVFLIRGWQAARRASTPSGESQRGSSKEL